MFSFVFSRAPRVDKVALVLQLHRTESQYSYPQDFAQGCVKGFLKP